MESKIQELTDKLFQEGVEKGNAEAQRIVADAKAEADRILKEAQTKADGIVAEAQKNGNELLENVKSELKLYAGQSLNALKSEITNLITDRIVKDSVKSVVADKDFLNGFIMKMAEMWAGNEGIVISTADADSLTAYFTKKAKDLLDKGQVKIEQVNGIKTLFSISPKDGSYRVDFGEEEFTNYFKEFLRPKLVKMLF